MASINVRSLLSKKLYEGELSFEFEPDPALLSIPFTAFASPARADLRYVIDEDKTLTVSGKLGYTLSGSCSRCLAAASQRVEGEVEGVFVEGEGDGEKYGYRSGTADLSELLKDATVFSMPMRLLCERCAAEIEE